MEIADINSLHTQVLWAAFGVAFVFGLVAQRTHFCTMGAISDIVNMGDWTRMRMWGMAVGVALIGFYGMAWMGWIDPLQTIYSTSRVIWLSAVVGGLLFGFGMVLASGCGSKTLVRIGAGSLKSLVVFAVMGVAAFATLSGVSAVLRVHTVDTVNFNMDRTSALPLWLSAQLGWQLPGGAFVLALLVGLALIAWAAMNRDFRSSTDHWLAGVGIGGTVVALWWVTGHMAFVQEHPLTLESVYLATNTGRMESLTFTAPMAYVLDWLIFFSDASKVLTIGVVTVWCGGWVLCVRCRQPEFPLGGLSQRPRHRLACGRRRLHGGGWRDRHGLHRGAGLVGPVHLESDQSDRRDRHPGGCLAWFAFPDLAA